jgi:hypothetical protein
MNGAILVLLLFSGDSTHSRTISYESITECRAAAEILAEKTNFMTSFKYFPPRIGDVWGVTCVPHSVSEATCAGNSPDNK